MIGILNVDKPAGFTSHDCVAILRRVSGVRKVGHTGTLDPMATGVLPVCFGRATRIMEYLDQDQKEYLCRMKLGMETDTCDCTGTVLRRADPSGIGTAQIRETFRRFSGTMQQVAPQYAALKVQGRKLYEYARAGEPVPVKSRWITIYEMQLLRIQGEEIFFRVRCSKGTYIRAICRDAGAILGCGGVMTELQRTASGIFHIEDAISLEYLRDMSPEELQERMIPIDRPLNWMGVIQLPSAPARGVIQGKPVLVKEAQIRQYSQRDHRYRLYCGNQFLGMGDLNAAGTLKAHKIFTTEIKQDDLI